MPENHGEKDVFEPKEFVSNFLPPVATDVLVAAAAKAREFPKDSLERARIIEKAVQKVRYLCPKSFRRDYGDSC